MTLMGRVWKLQQRNVIDLSWRNLRFERPKWYHENSIPLNIDSIPEEEDGARLIGGKGLSLDLDGIRGIEVLHRNSDRGIEILVKGEGEHLALMRHPEASALAAAILSSGKLGISFE